MVVSCAVCCCAHGSTNMSKKDLGRHTYSNTFLGFATRHFEDNPNVLLCNVCSEARNKAVRSSTWFLMIRINEREGDR